MSPKFCRRHAIAPGVALLIFSAVSSLAATAVAQSATVPPAPIVERPLTPATNDTPGDQPSSQHLWVPGHWRWHEGAYVWETGRWEVPPAPNLVWNSPQWQQQGNGYILREGFWDEAPPPPPIVSAPAAQPVQEIVATAPPPPPQREVVYERPTPAHVWVGGYWAWRGNRYSWVPGQWTPAPRNNVVWVPARWEQRGNRYVFVEGFWREAGVMVPTPPPAPQVVVAPQPAPPPQQVIVVQAPPQPRQEIVYARPSPHHIWIPGYWAWNHGRHVWIAGHYATPPRGRQHWVAPRWDRRGSSYVFMEGHWR